MTRKRIKWKEAERVEKAKNRARKMTFAIAL